VIIGTAKFWRPLPFAIGVAVAQTGHSEPLLPGEENLSAATNGLEAAAIC